MKNIAIILVIIVCSIYLIYLIYSTNTAYYFNLENFTSVSVGLNGENIELTGGCYKISFAVTQDQMMSLQTALTGLYYSRPLTHDLMKDVFDDFNIEVLLVEIDEYKDETYQARLFIRQNNKILNLDSRPSDAINIAVRYKKPIYVSTKIMEERGEIIC
jgi:bifunctional DNase/RNase